MLGSRRFPGQAARAAAIVALSAALLGTGAITAAASTAAAPRAGLGAASALASDAAPRAGTRPGDGRGEQDARARSSAPRPLPFGVGEVLTYRVTSSRFGVIGTGTMRVDGPERVRERTTLRLAFDFRSRVGPFTIEDRTRSWLDPVALVSLRYEKREKSPVSTRTEEVELFPDERRWRSAGEIEYPSPTDAPLDELSFLYFIRTLALEDGEVHVVERHFDEARNPVTIRVQGRERLDTPAGLFSTVVVEMKVKDAGRFRGDGVLRLHLTDDECRYPIRIETSMPIAGTMVLDLTALTPASPGPWT